MILVQLHGSVTSILKESFQRGKQVKVSRETIYLVSSTKSMAVCMIDFILKDVFQTFSKSVHFDKSQSEVVNQAFIHNMPAVYWNLNISIKNIQINIDIRHRHCSSFRCKKLLSFYESHGNGEIVFGQHLNSCNNETEKRFSP